MNDVEKARSRAEAVNETPARALSSARRAQLWEGLNRYLASEASHEQRLAEEERREAEEAERQEGDEAERQEADEAEPEAGEAPGDRGNA